MPTSSMAAFRFARFRQELSDALRVCRLMAFALIAAAVVPASASAIPLSAAPCSAPGRVVEADRTTVLTRVGDRSTYREGFYACVRGHRARLVVSGASAIQTTSATGSYQPVDVARGRVAWIEITGTREVTGATVNTLNLWTGRKVTSRVKSSFPLSLALGADGELFWTTRIFPTLDTIAYEVHQRTPAGTDKTIDVGAIPPLSLSVTPESVTWIKDRLPQGFPLG